MYKPDRARLAQFWSTFQVMIGVTDHGVRTSHWYSVVACHPYTWTLLCILGSLYWSSTLHKKTVKQTKYSFHLGHMVFTLWKLPSNSSSYNRTQVIQSTSNMKASATVPFQIKLHHTPALLVAVFLPCLVIIGWVSRNFTNIKNLANDTKQKYI